MRYAQIKAPARYPYIATLRIDPADYHRLEQFADDSETFRILECDRSEPDLWTVHIACASQEVADRMEDGWN